MSVGSVAPDRRRCWVSTGASILSLTTDPPSLSLYFPILTWGMSFEKKSFPRAGPGRPSFYSESPSLYVIANIFFLSSPFKLCMYASWSTLSHLVVVCVCVHTPSKEYILKKKEKSERKREN